MFNACPRIERATWTYPAVQYEKTFDIIPPRMSVVYVFFPIEI